ncbi:MULTISPECIES: hypothetical protein [unclassified Bradyrhizobium]|uniref:hypothetical protein n=1 Tax=unclassified Bradyrhizobium TaxID=2631580 RepID=UPI0028E1E3D7|nr:MULTISPECIES: hypothetical protein [unclassified Bradyrhizobium]
MLARAFLRWCALEALRPSQLLAAGGPWETSAGDNVFDSRIDPIDDLDPTEPLPVITVFTEDTKLTKIAQSGPLFYKGAVDLTFEIGCVAKFQAADSDQLILDYADTDLALEAKLDAIEEQIKFCLISSPHGVLFRKMAKGVPEHWESTAKRGGEEAYRLARRHMTVTCNLKDYVFEGAPDAQRANLLRLPPALQDIAAALTSNGSTYFASAILGVAKAMPQMPVRTNLAGVSIQTTIGEAGNMVEVTAELKSALAVTQVVATGAAVEIDYAGGTMQQLILAGDVPKLNVVNWPGPGKIGRLILNITNTGAFAVKGWPAGTLWIGGMAPLLTEGAGKRDVVVLTTQDGGATVYGNIVGQDYS